MAGEVPTTVKPSVESLELMRLKLGHLNAVAALEYIAKMESVGRPVSADVLHAAEEWCVDNLPTTRFTLTGKSEDDGETETAGPVAEVMKQSEIPPNLPFEKGGTGTGETEPEYVDENDTVLMREFANAGQMLTAVWGAFRWRKSAVEEIIGELNLSKPDERARAWRLIVLKYRELHPEKKEG